MQILLPRARRHARAPLSCALILALGLLLGLTPTTARAATLTVTNTNDSGPGSLRAAIATANTDDGDDTINFSFPANVYPQITLSSTLTITAPMTISGLSGQNIIIDGGGSVQVFSISGGTTIQPVVLAGLTIADGNAPSDTDLANLGAEGGTGGGIYNSPNAVLTLTDCIVTDNTCTASVEAPEYTGAGGGIFNSRGAVLTLTGCMLSGNSVPGGEGGGLYNDLFGTVTLTGCTFAQNSVSSGQYGGEGGGLCTDGTATLTGCTFTHNSARFDGGYENPFYGIGGGLCDYEANVTLTGCTFDGNSASNGGGIDHIGGYADTVKLTNCILTRNSATYYGGAIVTGSAPPSGGVPTPADADTLTNCTLTANSATTSGGGVYSNISGGTCVLDNDILYGDTAPRNNEVDVPTVYLNYCDIDQTNTLTGTDGDIDADPHFVNAPYDVTLAAGSPCIGAGDPAQAGTRDINGAVRFNPPTIGANEGYSLVVTNTNASGNGSLSGVLLAARSAPDAVITFAPFAFGSFTTITPAAELELPQSVEIIGPASGVAVSGGNSHGVFQVDSGVQAILTGLTMTDGSASSGDGGGIDNFGGTATLTGCTLTGNSAYFGGGLYNDDGGTVTLTGCTLTGNSATGDGGAIGTTGTTFSSNGTVTLTDCTLTGNSAAIQGGAIEVGNGAVTLTDCTLSGNSAHGGTGGAILIFAGTLTLTDCSFTGNSANNSSTGGGLPAGAGGAISNLAGTATLDNDILYGDTAITSNEISGSVSATYCDINQNGYTGTGDIRADPMFVGPAGNLQLQPSSPCIGQGDPTQAGTYDIIGTLRPNPPSIGAYEGTPAATRTHLQSSSDSSLYGQNVTFTATVDNTTPGSRTFPAGSVEFYVNGVPAATVSLTNVNGAATAAYTTSSLRSGTDFVTATLMSNTQFASSSSDPLRHDVGAASTSTGLTSYSNPSTVGEEVYFAATIADTSPDSSGVPTGSVAFYINGSTTPFDTETLDSGSADTNYTFTQTGTYTITAKYLGDSNFTGSSGSLSPSQQITLNTPRVVFVNANPSPSVYGQPVTFSVFVGSSDPNLPSPTGTVTLQGLPGNPVVTLTGDGHPDGDSFGSYATNALPVGPNNYSAVYSGDGTYANQTVTGLSQTVNPGPAAKLTLTAPAAATAGQPFQANVSETDAYGNAVTSTATVSFNSTDARAALPAPVSLTNGTATVTVTDYTAGSQTLTASASGLTPGTAATTVSSDPQGTPNVSVNSVVLSRTSSTVVTVSFTLVNTGVGAANAVKVTVAKLGTVGAASLPAPVSIGAGQSQAYSLTFTGVPPGATTLTLNGAYTGTPRGTSTGYAFSGGKKVTVP